MGVIFVFELFAVFYDSKSFMTFLALLVATTYGHTVRNATVIQQLHCSAFATAGGRLIGLSPSRRVGNCCASKLMPPRLARPLKYPGW